MKISNKIKIYIFFVILVISSLFGILKYTTEATFSDADISAMLSADGLNRNGINIKIISPFSPKTPSYDEIGVFPIDKSVFNSSPDFFCAQHGTAYGNSNRETRLGASPGDFHDYYTITYHNVKEGNSMPAYPFNSTYYSTDPKGDVPDPTTEALAYLDRGGSYKTDPSFNASTVYTGHREKDETGASTIYTNWVYVPTNITFGCGSDAEELENTEITGRGLAFLMACYKQSYAERASTGYNNDPLQFAVWDWLNQLGEKPNPLKAAALEYQDYHEKSREPNVDTVPDAHVGTTINEAGTEYTVGPFKMSNYVRAEDFKYNEVGKYEVTEYEGTEDEEVYNLNVNNQGVDLQSKFGSLKGSIIKTEVVVTNENGDESKIDLGMVPEPGDEYSISLDAGKLEGYDELKDIIFTYQRVHANGEGVRYYGYQEALNFTEKSGSATTGCTTYYCQNESPSYAHHHTSSYGGNQTCTYTWTCDDHDEGHGCAGNHSKSGCDCACSESTCPGHLNCSSDHHKSTCSEDCTTSHGHNSSCYYKHGCAGNHSKSGCYCSCPGHSDTHESYFLCTHKHEECKSFQWNMLPTNGGDYAQDGLAAGGILSTEQIEYKIRVSVPLKTQMEIYKYITKVEHVGEEIVTYNDETERREMSMGEKYEDSLKVEKGDKITYKVEIVNDSRFPTRVKVRDTLPEPCSDEDIPDDIELEKWITVNPKSKKEYTITLRTNADTGKHTNTIEFITTNKTNPTMQYTSWGDDATHGPHTYGSIVNIYTREKDADTFEIKEYYVGIQKYIYDVEHNPEDSGISGIDTTMAESNVRKRGSMSEADKINNPVYAEYGDTVTYRILVYNTTGDKDKEFDIERTEEPYWEPNKVYVDIEDTLPNSFEMEEVSISSPSMTVGDSHTISYPNESTTGGKLIIDDLMVPENAITMITVKLKVKEHAKGTVEENNAKLVNDIKNINRGPAKGSTVLDKYCVVINNSTNLESADYYKLNNYNVSVDKYLYKYDEAKLNENNNILLITEEDTIVDENDILKETRKNTSTGTTSVSDGNVIDTVKTYDISHENNKQENPVNVEKGEKLTYQIRVSNEAKTVNKGNQSSTKRATQVRPTTVIDYMQKGLELDGIKAQIFDSSDNPVGNEFAVGHSGGTDKTIDGVLCTAYQFGMENDKILDPGQYIIFNVEVTVKESNMYLYSLMNKAELSVLTNINNTEEEAYEVKNASYNENIARQQTSSEYVKMKDLVISGKVWVDFDKNGLMDDTATRYDEDGNVDNTATELNKINNNINESAMKKEVIVRLYRVGDPNNPIRTTKTDENGLYTFSRDENLNFGAYPTFNHTTGYSNETKYQRIDKASNKDSYGKYTTGSEYYQYYVEFEYDGLVYKSTELYAGKDNLSNDGSFDTIYTIDSNAAELEDDRNKFNKLYEYISYNIAYDENLNETINGNLVFQKDGHESYLMENPERKMIAKSFVSKENYADIEYLWLFPFTTSNFEYPETDYLKYINLGLELREDVDLELSKDVYKVKTTINGEEMEYDYNLGYTANYLNDYIIKKPYGFEIYEADYKYRVDQYFSDAVRNYKGINGEDELNVEVTYRINLKNKSTKDDDEVESSPDTQLYVRIHEVLDLYDENFMKLSYKDGVVTKDNNKITVKQTGEDGFLTNKEISIGEAWMFMEESDVPEGLTKSTEKYVITNPSGGEKPNYKEDESGTIVKAYLTIGEKSSRGTGVYSAKTNNFTADGYNTAYIRGMEKIVLSEGQDLDIYIKYVVDKDKLITTIENERFDEEIDQNVFVKNIDDGVISGKITTTEIISTTEAEIERSLKLAERCTSKYKTLGIITPANKEKIESGEYTDFGRGTENIAQINAYSVWYDANGTKHASLVDKDSNAGNLGVQNISTGVSPKDPSGGYIENEDASADDIRYYEDTSYKTGIEIAAEGSENAITRKTEEETNIYLEIFGKISKPILREIKGKVWDDSRSHVLTAETDLETAKDKQYVGNGLYTDAEDGSKRDVKHGEAKYNENLPQFYKVDTNGDGKYDTENNDLLVKDAKAEYIEIVKVPAGSEIHYYEEVLMGVTWNQAQYERTNEQGEYHLKGMKPGNYIVRFTYGDTIDDANYSVADVENIPEEQKHMLIFNGQDYKSTVYNPHLEDTQLDNDEVLRRLEAEDLSDARDDEIRRLKTNAYSEVMTNNTAEILKGLANGTNLTPNSNKNTLSALKELTDNTYMNAETREFLVKAEKLTVDQTEKYSETKTLAKTEINAIDNTKEVKLKEMLYKNLEYLKNTMVANREFVIENVDFGIEYRPESEISLIKEISEIKLITEDNSTLVDLYFKSESDGRHRKHSIVPEKSVGLELVQFITNDYTTKPLINNLTSEESLQGLVYIQVEQEILQGCTVEITYSFEAQNNSEVDRISTNLDEIRYKENPKTAALITEFKNKGFEIVPKVLDKDGNVIIKDGKPVEKYTASGTAANIIDAETYRDEVQTIGDATLGDTEDVTIRYRIKEKLMTTITGNGDDNYFGKYNGYSYYTGKVVNGIDTVATLKFDKILDYVDTGLEYEPDTEQKNVTDKLWTKVESAELKDFVLYLRREDVPEQERILKNTEGIKYDSLVISLDDRRKDDKYSSNKTEFAGIDNSNVKNNDLSRFLLPKVLETGYLPNKEEEYDNYINIVNALTDEQKRTFTGKISLVVSKVLASETNSDDMTYENMAEIVQFTTLTGRRTNFATTIGNADVHSVKDKYSGINPGSIEFTTASLEPDTSATETVTLIPPTGLMKNRRAIVSIMETAKTGVEVMSMTGLVVAIVAVIIFLALFTIRKYKKRRIK